jgi:hypothetical protein
MVQVLSPWRLRTKLSTTHLLVCLFVGGLAYRFSENTCRVSYP